MNPNTKQIRTSVSGTKSAGVRYGVGVKKKMPKSVRKYIRREKARIRRQFFDVKEQEELIKKLYQRFSKKNEN